MWSDVGALALPIAACRLGASIICVEADPQIVWLLRLNVTENGRSNIRIVNCLAEPTDDPQVSFYRSPAAKFGMGSIGPQFGASPTKLPQRPLDQVLDKLAIDGIDVVKLDIEGAEFGALQGLGSWLCLLSKGVGEPRQAPRLADELAATSDLFEFADWAESRIEGQAAGDAQKFLLSIGYQLFRVTPSRCRRRQFSRDSDAVDVHPCSIGFQHCLPQGLPRRTPTSAPTLV